MTRALVLIASLTASPVLAAGLSTPFVDVVVNDVRPGTVLPVRHSSAEGLALDNLSDVPLRVRVMVLVPSESELRGGAGAIPDVGWVRIEPAQLVLPPRQRAVFRVTLHVPKGRKYRGKYYQASIWSRSEPLEGNQVALSAGLLSRLRFKTK